MSSRIQRKSSATRFETRDLIIWGVMALLCIGGGWWWLQNMERKWQPTLNALEEYRKHPMLAAQRLATLNGYHVKEFEHFSLEAVDKAGRGSLIMSNNDGIMNGEQRDALLAWVAQGNTLITFPQIRYQVDPDPSAEKMREEVNKTLKGDPRDPLTEETEALFEPSGRRIDNNMQDPIGEYLGVYTYNPKLARIASAQATLPKPETENQAASASQISPQNDEYDGYDDEDEWEDEINASVPVTSNEGNPQASADYPDQQLDLVPTLANNQSFVRLPHTGRGLIVSRGPLRLVGFKRGQTPLYQADDGTSLRVYQVGKGKIVVMPQNIFTHHSLQREDNAQLLLDLLSLTPDGKQLTIIKNLKAMHWPELVWKYFSLAVLSLGLLIILWAWRKARRFGAILPEPNLERRSLLEHIDASARWAWTTAIGRQNMLDAARAACKESLRRRAPELLRLNTTEQIHELASQSGLDAQALANAWLDSAAAHPLQFTKQIQLLQRLRAHYER
ncbi:MAG: DUF4350 domain-containing protein [Burkholderiaceae bacterium]|nr:MAG: DUF4350 domain-containing protein [Burkholderiaceae bacterium]